MLQHPQSPGVLLPPLAHPVGVSQQSHLLQVWPHTQTCACLCLALKGIASAKYILKYFSHQPKVVTHIFHHYLIFCTKQVRTQLPGRNNTLLLSSNDILVLISLSARPPIALNSHSIQDIPFITALTTVYWNDLFSCLSNALGAPPGYLKQLVQCQAHTWQALKNIAEPNLSNPFLRQALESSGEKKIAPQNVSRNVEFCSEEMFLQMHHFTGFCKGSHHNLINLDQQLTFEDRYALSVLR